MDNFGDINLEERKKKFLNFFKKSQIWVIGILVVALILGIYIRSLPMTDYNGHPGLWDITTNSWTLGPDLDPWLFLRYAKTIIDNGSLPKMDMFRNVPLGFDTTTETMLLPYMIVWTYKILNLIGVSSSVEFAGVIFPVIMFALTIISFFLFSREIFIRKDKESKTKANLIALIATFFMIVMPSFLSRTVAGIPEKESAGFFFIFLSLYLFLKAWKSEKIKNSVIWGILAGISTAGITLIWGGSLFVFIPLGGAGIIAFIFNKVEKKELIIYTIWLIVSFLIVLIFSNRFSLNSLLTSLSTAPAVIAVFIFLVHFILWNTNLSRTDLLRKSKLPKSIISIIVAIILMVVLSSLFFGPSFVSDKLKDVHQKVFHPTLGRWNTTVAENRQPEFSEWVQSFGPYVKNIPLFFWMFLIGSIALFKKMTNKLRKKESWVLTGLYFFFLCGMIFSRYSERFPTSALEQKIYYFYLITFLIISIAIPAYLFLNQKEKSSKMHYILLITPIILFGSLLLSKNNPSFFFNGENFISKAFYYLSALLFAGYVIYYYLEDYKKGEERFKKIDYEFILLLSLFLLTVFSARGAVRLVMVLATVAPIFVGFLIVRVCSKFLNAKNETIKWTFGILAVLIIVASIFSFNAYLHGIKEDKYIADKVIIPSMAGILQQAYNFVPSYYNQQWQKAMDWVRNETPANAVFAHWWDYGYWVQSIGNRATVLDGGNAIAYWNYLMGRHVLTGDNQSDALEFLYNHNATHMLVDSSDIGKYGAFSSIGSNEDYDRYSWFGNFIIDETQTQETNNETVYFYRGGLALDEDLVINENGRDILLPSKTSGVGAIIIPIQKNGNLTNFEQPYAIIVSNNQQHRINLRYLYVEGRMIDFGDGVEACAKIIPYVNSNNVNKIGAILFISKRDLRGFFSQVYLLDDPFNNFPNFKLVHTEQNLIIDSLNAQGLDLPDFVYYQGMQGPIKIWEIEYTGEEQIKEQYLDKNANKYLSWQL